MKHIKFISDRTVRPDVDKLFMSVAKAFGNECLYSIASVDYGTFTSKRSAKKIVNDYAVTQLPFVVFLEEEVQDSGGEVYAALYSEEGPITLERIQQKL